MCDFFPLPTKKALATLLHRGGRGGRGDDVRLAGYCTAANAAGAAMMCGSRCGLLHRGERGGRGDDVRLALRAIAPRRARRARRG